MDKKEKLKGIIAGIVTVAVIGLFVWLMMVNLAIGIIVFVAFLGTMLGIALLKPANKPKATKVVKEIKDFKFELYPLEKLVIDDTSIYLGKSKEQFIKLLGKPEAEHENWGGDGHTCYYFNSNLSFDCDKNDNIRFIEFLGGHYGELKPYIHGISAFDISMNKLYDILKEYNNGRIYEESDEGYGFVEISVGIWKDGANDESDYWTTIGIGEKDCYLEFYE